MLLRFKNKLTSALLIPILFTGMLTHTSCVKYSSITYDAIANEMKTYSPSIRVHHKNGNSYDIQVTKVSKTGLTGYSSEGDSYQKVDFERASISSLSQKEKTRVGDLSTKAGRGVLKAVVVGVIVVVIIYYVVNDSSDDNHSFSH